MCANFFEKGKRKRRANLISIVTQLKQIIAAILQIPRFNWIEPSVLTEIVLRQKNLSTCVFFISMKVGQRASLIFRAHLMPRLSNDWLLNPVITGVFTEKLSETRNEPRWHVFTVFELKQKLLLGSVLCFLEVARALSSKAWAKTFLALNKAKIHPSRAWSLA